MNWSLRQKWVITILLNTMTLCIGLSTSAYSSGIGRMSRELGVSEVAGQVGMFMFNAGMLDKASRAGISPEADNTYHMLGPSQHVRSLLCFLPLSVSLQEDGTSTYRRLASSLFSLSCSCLAPTWPLSCLEGCSRVQQDPSAQFSSVALSQTCSMTRIDQCPCLSSHSLLSSRRLPHLCTVDTLTRT